MRTYPGAYMPTVCICTCTSFMKSNARNWCKLYQPDKMQVRRGKSCRWCLRYHSCW